MNSPAVAERPQTTPRPPPSGEPRSQDGLRVSEEVYWRDYYAYPDVRADFCYEWNRGRLEEKPVSDFETNQVHVWFLILLQQYLEAHPIGQLITLDMGFRLRLPDGVVIRRPDLAVIRGDNPEQPGPQECSYRGTYDLCIEALSDRERAAIERDTITKKAEYAAAGVAEYFILHREAAHQAFYTLSAAGLYVPITPQHGVIRSRVLPGLQFRLEHLCTRPAHSDLRHDPVYADFIFPAWQATEERAAAAVAKAEREAEARAHLAARLREETEARTRAEAELARLQANSAR